MELQTAQLKVQQTQLTELQCRHWRTARRRELLTERPTERQTAWQMGLTAQLKVQQTV